MFFYLYLDSSHDKDLDTDPNLNIDLYLEADLNIIAWLGREGPLTLTDMDLYLYFNLNSSHDTDLDTDLNLDTPLKPEIGVDFELTLNHSLTRRKEAPEAATASQNLKIIWNNIFIRYLFDNQNFEKGIYLCKFCKLIVRGRYRL